MASDFQVVFLSCVLVENSFHLLSFKWFCSRRGQRGQAVAEHSGVIFARHGKSVAREVLQSQGVPGGGGTGALRPHGAVVHRVAGIA